MHLAVERVETSDRPLPSSKIKTNTTGSSVPEIRAIGVKDYLCVSRNGLLGETYRNHESKGASPISATQPADCGQISNAMYRINGRRGNYAVRCSGVVSGIPFFASICNTN